MTRTAVEDLDRLIVTLTLPPDTRERVKRSVGPLREFPRLGAQLEGRWESFRFVLGPWRSMLLVYAYDEHADRVSVVTVQDARSGRSATSSS